MGGSILAGADRRSGPRNASLTTTKYFVYISAMARLPRPTEAELAILRVLWERGPSTVRQVNDVLSESRETGYTTTLKFMQIMAEKGLVTRDERDRSHVYSARLSQDQTQRQLVSDLVDRAFGGSATALVLQALSAHPASPDELREIQRLIDDYKRTARSGAPAKTGKARKTSGEHHG